MPVAKEVRLEGKHLDPNLTREFIKEPGAFAEEDQAHIITCSICQEEIRRTKEAWHGR